MNQNIGSSKPVLFTPTGSSSPGFLVKIFHNTYLPEFFTWK